ncbi:MAG: class I SAM-dependent methyltransferase [Anaerocolumna sp.]
MSMPTVVQPEGNFYDKYNNKNSLIKAIMNGFFKKLDGLLDMIEYGNVLEVGCGEGYVSDFIYRKNVVSIQAFDISENVISEAQKQFPYIQFKVGSIYSGGGYNSNSFDLVICSEVLEHLEEPQKALIEILKVAKKYVIVSVPNEPVWRLLNICRGKYLNQLGNTPGHIQHWSKKKFIKMCESAGVDILTVNSPFPWTMLLLEKRNG